MTQETLQMLRYAKDSLRRQILSWRRNLSHWWRFWNSYQHYRRLAPPDRQPLPQYLHPCLGDNTEKTPIEPIYYYQDAWAFEKIISRRPSHHVDAGSHHKFLALLSKVVPVTMVDLRPLSLPLDTLEFRKGSILSLPFEDATVPSLSSLCVVEHVGLGRYGDPLDPYGSEKAISELKRVLAPNGCLYLSVPIGDHSIVVFNAGRVFARKYLMELIHPLIIVEQRFIVGKSFQATYEPRHMFGTTGLFELTKPPITPERD